MNNFDLTKIVKYVPVLKDKIENLIFMFIDFEDIVDSTSQFPQMGVKVFEKKLNKWGINQTIFINPTNVHKDKIFVIRVDPDTSSPGLTLFTSININGSRHTKLLKILRKMGKDIKDLEFEYCITKIGFKPNTFVRCIYLKEN